MTAGRCSRLWEVEAARDARLSGPLLAAHYTHVAGCRECSQEQQALDALVRGLRDAEPVVDEVALRRLRQTTLARAFTLSLARAPARIRGIVASLGCAFAAAAIAYVFFVSQPAAHGMPSVAITPGVSGATWTRQSTRDVERVDLSDGVLGVVVHRRPHDRRVIMHVPDGEIEDFGTAFNVRVDAGHTLRVAVREGAVVFRRRDAAQLRLSAGMAWSANDNAPLASVAGGSSAQPAAGPSPAPVAQPLPNADAIRRANSRSKHARAHSARLDASAHENDAAAEDAVYLHVLALLREKRGEEARLAAVQYLRRFPNGFRRLELQRIAQSAPQP